jgi:hypothetical protein
MKCELNEEDINRLSLDVIQIAESALYYLGHGAIPEVKVRLEHIIQRVDQTAPKAGE